MIALPDRPRAITSEYFTFSLSSSSFCVSFSHLLFFSLHLSQFLWLKQHRKSLGPRRQSNPDPQHPSISTHARPKRTEPWQKKREMESRGPGRNEITKVLLCFTLNVYFWSCGLLEMKRSLNTLLLSFVYLQWKYKQRKRICVIRSPWTVINKCHVIDTSHSAGE